MISVSKEQLLKLREYAQWHDSIDALRLIDSILKDSSAKRGPDGDAHTNK